MKYDEMIRNKSLDDFKQFSSQINKKKELEESNMSSLKEEALAYEKSTTKNVADLEVFDIGMETLTHEGINKEGEKYSYKYITDKEGIKYRVPWSVLDQIKAFLEENPDQTLFKVKKSGEGKQTAYTVIPKMK